MEWIIDRIERNENTSDSIAVIECNTEAGRCVFELNTRLLPKEAREGSVLKICTDISAEAEKKERSKKLMDKLFEA